MNCYKEFAHIYDDLINDDINYKKWSNAIINICDELNIDKDNYLDLACGTGNLTLELASSFKSVWAVDLSYDMLTEAENKFRNNKIKSKFVCQDICELNLNKKFNLITCCLDSVNYILDKNKLKSFFGNVYDHLEDKGVFIFDINSYYKLSEVLGDNLFNYDDENITYIWENYLEDDIVQMNISFFINKEDNIYFRFDEEHKERAYKKEYIEEIIKNKGFKIVKLLDSYEEKKIMDKTERIVFVLVKE